MTGASLRIRPARPQDESLLWTVLYYASHSNDEPGVGLDDIRGNPDLIRYVSGWGREGDLGVVAERGEDPLGAAWLRRLPETERHEPTYVDAETPELAVAVLPGHEGRGTGTAMLDALFELARRSYPRVVLSVRADNGARRLYRRLGFVEVEHIRNRVGTESIKMVLEL